MRMTPGNDGGKAQRSRIAPDSATSLLFFSSRRTFCNLYRPVRKRFAGTVIARKAAENRDFSSVSKIFDRPRCADAPQSSVLDPAKNN